VNQSLEALVRIVRFVFLIIVSVPFLASSFAQQTPSASSAQAVKLLQQALAALNPGAPTTDVTLSGTVKYIAGSDDESGTFTVEGAANGSARLSFLLPSGADTEVFNFANTPAGTWSGPDGVLHPIAFDNLLAEQVWFCPNLVISRRLSSAAYMASYIGHETLEGQAVEHVSVSEIAPVPNPPEGVTFEHLTQIDFYLDSTTLLPAAITYNIHPDNNALLDVPVESRFSDYRSVSGAKIPFHIQRFLNNTLTKDLEVLNVTINSGIPSTVFSVR
jgi:hypothetical protein